MITRPARNSTTVDSPWVLAHDVNVIFVGTDKVSSRSTLSCYANSFASIWGQTIAEAWIESECDASNDSYLCKDECKSKSACKRCHAKAYTVANTWAQAVIQVEVERDGICLETSTETFGTASTTPDRQLISGQVGGIRIYTTSTCSRHDVDVTVTH